MGTALILMGILSIENPEAMRVPVGLALALVGVLLAYLAVRDIRRSRK